MNDIAPIERLEAAMLQLPQVECPVIHRFGPGIYIREVQIPAGTFAVGHRQRCEHMNIFLKGRVTIFTENGTASDLIAPMMFVGKPGRKIGYIHEDMVWLNVYATDEKDIERLETMFLEKSITWEEQARIARGQQLLLGNIDADDYLEMLKQFGIHPDTVRSQTESEEDQIPFPVGSYKCKLGPSSIHGKGLFATALIEEGETIAPARVEGKRTPAGRFTNHSKQPNAMMLKRASGDIDLVANRSIGGCIGGIDGEEITIDYRQALSLQIGSL